MLVSEHFGDCVFFQVIKQGVDVPEGQNDLRRNQLRELAQLNGTLREGDGKFHLLFPLLLTCLKDN